jgi:hypothetical protein
MKFFRDNFSNTLHIFCLTATALNDIFHVNDLSARILCCQDGIWFNKSWLAQQLLSLMTRYSKFSDEG